MRVIKQLLTAVLVLASLAGTAQAAFVQNFTFNTLQAQGRSGEMVFELAPGSSNQNAFAAITDFFNHNGTVGSVLERTGSSYGTLSGNLADVNNLEFQAAPPLSRYVQSITFGDYLSFTLSTCCSDSLFSLTLRDNNHIPLLSSNPNGHLLEVSGGNNCSTCTVNSTPTPVPAAAWLLASGVMGLIGLRRRIA